MKYADISAGRLTFALCAALALAGAALAQAEPRARKFGEYVNQFTACNAGAYLDGLALELQNNPGLSGYVVIYGPGGPSGRFGERAADATKNYLVNVRGTEGSRVEVVYGGPYKSLLEVSTELWLVPEGAQRPPTNVYTPGLRAEGKFAEFGTWDGPAEREGWSDSGEVALVGLSDLLRGRADALAYVVAYNGAESAPGAWRRAAESRAGMLRRNGVGPERVRVIFGGYAEEAKVQFWVLPPDAKPPVRPRRERRPERSVQIASLDEFQLKYGEGERWGFEGLADLLKADAQLTGCVVIRLAPAEIKDADPAWPVDADEPPEVDLVQLAEKWKAELKKNGVGEHRLIVMVVPPRNGGSGGKLETWVVPPGASLPDASAVEGEIEEGEESPEEF